MIEDGAGPNNKVGCGLATVAAIAILIVYGAGIVRTRPAAGGFALQAIGRRPARAGAAEYRGSRNGLLPRAFPDDPRALIVPAAWRDGTYYGWGVSRHGNIQAEVIVAAGRIAYAGIAQCRTRYSCSVINGLLPEVAQRQSPEVDYVSGATESANAFYYAVVEALELAK